MRGLKDRATQEFWRDHALSAGGAGMLPANKPATCSRKMEYLRSFARSAN